MSLLRSGLNQLSYTGVEALQPPNLTVHKRDPISGAVANRDIRTFNIGSLWLNDVNRSLWVLANKDGGVPAWVLLSGGGNGILSITGDTGGPVFGDGMQNVNITGDGVTIAVAGSPMTNTLVISTIGGGGGSLNQVTGDLGTPVTPTGGNIDIITGLASNNAGSTFAFSGSGSILTLDASDSDENTCFGFNAGNTSTVAIQNTCFGYNAGSSLAGGSISAASYNVFIGNGAGENVNGSTPAQGSYHTAVGSLALNQATTSEGNTAIGNGSFYALTTGSFNTGVGVNTGCNGTNGVTTGQRNTLIGHFAGSNYRSSESNNILIGAAVNGTLGESNVIRIGHSTNTTTYIAGIVGNTVSNALMVTIDSSTSQLGTQAIPTGMMTWTVVTGSSQAMAANNGYIANNAGTINFSLPASSAVGDIIRITGINNATGWQISQAAGQQIFFGTSSTTSGATGTITSSATRDSIEIVCVVANTIWNVLSVIGNPTIV